MVRKDPVGGAAVAQGTMPEVVGRGSFCKGGDCLGFGGYELGKARQQKRICWADSEEELYPTDSAVRQKEERKAREEALEAEGLTKEEV